MGEFQFRYGTAAEGASANPILDTAEPAYITDTGDLLIGDGETPLTAVAPWSPNTVKGAAKLVSIGDLGVSGAALSGGSAAATNTVGTSEMMFTIGVGATDICLLFTHWYSDTVSGAIADINPSGPITFSASIRVVSTTCPGTVVSATPWQLTFNGRTSVTLDPGGSVISDLEGLSLAPGDVVAIRTYLSSGTAYSPRQVYGNHAGAYGGFTAASDLTASSTAIAGSAGLYYGPAAILGYTDSGANAESVFICGDSIGTGAGDAGILYTQPALVPGGFLMRALSGQAGMINASKGGDLLTWFQATNGSRRRIRNATRTNSAIIEYGPNDFSGGESADTVQAAVLDTAPKIRRMGNSKVFVLTVCPRTTSTDNWATTANQTPVSGNSQRIAYNTWLRAGAPIDPTTKAAVAVGTPGALVVGQFRHPISDVFDVAAQVESSLNSGVWKPARRVITGSITSGSSTLTTSSTFNGANQENGGDTGSTFFLAGAGAAGAALTGNLATYNSPTSFGINAAAAATVTNATLVIGTSTIDGVHPSGESHDAMAQVIDRTKI